MGTVPGEYKTRKSLFAEKLSEFSERVSKDLEKGEDKSIDKEPEGESDQKNKKASE